MMRKTLLLAATGFLLMAADRPASFTSPVPDPDLASMRGGFRLPNGIDVSLAVQSDTRVNGAVVLRSVFAADQGPARLQVFVARPGETAGAGSGQQGSGQQGGGGSGTAMPSITFNPQTGLVVIPAASGPRVSIGVGANGGGVSADPGGGLDRVDVPTGGSLATAGGVVSILPQNMGGRIRFQSDGLDTSHFFGSAYGSLTANTASDRAIDTVTTISLDLGNVGPDVLGSSLMQVENLALESTAMLNTGG